VSVAVPLETPTVSGPEEGPERSDFWEYLARKVGAAIVSFVMLLIVGFVIFNLMPADPVSAVTRGRPTSDAQMENLRHQLGLDQPLWERFLHFAGNTVTGDLGYSFENNQSVASLIADRLWPTILLMGSSTLISIVLGLWLGIRAGWRPGSALDLFVRLPAPARLFGFHALKISRGAGRGQARVSGWRRRASGR